LSYKWYKNRKTHQCAMMEIQDNKVFSLNPS